MENVYKKPESEMSEIEQLTKTIADLIEKKGISFVFNGEPWYYRGRNDELSLTEILNVLPESFKHAGDEYYFDLSFLGKVGQRTFYASYMEEEAHRDIGFFYDKNPAIACAKLLIYLLTDWEEVFK